MNEVEGIPFYETFKIAHDLVQFYISLYCWDRKNI